MKWDSWNSLEYDTHQAEGLATAGLPPLVAAVLAARGMEAPEQAQRWLCTSLDQLHDPLLLRDIQPGVDRIRSAIANGERVAVYGDYDVDGITSSALMAGYLQSKGLICDVYIPDRLEEGYGLNTAALATLGKQGVTLVITVDCGITAVEEAEFAKGLGIDLVITDHHEAQQTLPQAVAVIDPKRSDCPYPDKHLAGVGVAFKLVCAIEGPEQTGQLIQQYSDLVAVGTVADVMELVGENRIFVTHGLEAIRSGNRLGLSALIEEAGIEQAKVNVTNIGYAIAPRLNAAGRMGRSQLSYSLLETDSPQQAVALAETLCTLNRERQQVEQEILDQSLAILEAQSGDMGPIILASESWHKGVVGIVSSRLVERYQVPVIMLCIENGEAKGSCRSARGFNLFDALTACADTLETFGGHELAAGLTVSQDKLEPFKAAFTEYFHAHPPRGTGSVLETDFTLTDPQLLTLEQVDALSLLEPCGRGNPSPVLIMEGATLLRAYPIGGGKHMKLQVERWGQTYDCVFFSAAMAEFPAREGELIDLAFTPQINAFRGKTTVQLLTRDVCLSEHRQAGRARHLYRRLTQGEPLSTGEAQMLCPQRDDFVRLYKHLRAGQRDTALHGKADEVLVALTRSSAGGTAAKYYTCLKVMDELGLASVREQEDTLDIQLHPQAEKVDLNASSVLSALRQALG